MKLSFLMPAKNVEYFIKEAINAIRFSGFNNWELVICEDNSEDATYETALSFAKEDKRIKLVKNIGKGKVQGLNTAYEYSCGDYIKCVDSDDIISRKYFLFIKDILSSNASCHDYFVVDENLKNKSIYSMNRRFFTVSYPTVIKEMMSLPRAVWTIPRLIAEKIFPIPEELPYEDVWFSFIIKQYSKGIIYIPKPLYYYRQHSNQTFGGVLNYSPYIISFRADRIYKSLKIFGEQSERLGTDISYWTRKQKSYYALLKKKYLPIKEILESQLQLSRKIELVLYKKLYWMVPFLKRIQWRYDRIFA